MYHLTYIFLLLTLLLSVFSPAYASVEKPIKLGHYSYWTVYKLNHGKNSVCYMSIIANPPKVRKETKQIRGDVTLMITHRPAENSVDVVSYAVGGKLKPASNVKVILGDKRFNLFTHADTAWARDDMTDHKLTMALRAGYYVTFLGRLASGDKFADSVNLKGSAKAYEAMSRACGVKVLPVPESARPVYPKFKDR